MLSWLTDHWLLVCVHLKGLWNHQVHQIPLLGSTHRNVLTLLALSPERLCSNKGTTLLQLGFNCTLFLFPLPKSKIDMTAQNRFDTHQHHLTPCSLRKLLQYVNAESLVEPTGHLS